MSVHIAQKMEKYCAIYNKIKINIFRKIPVTNCIFFLILSTIEVFMHSMLKNQTITYMSYVLYCTSTYVLQCSDRIFATGKAQKIPKLNLAPIHTKKVNIWCKNLQIFPTIPCDDKKG